MNKWLKGLAPKASRMRRPAAEIGSLAAVCWATGKLGLLLAFEHPENAPVWPPTGVALAALLVLGYRIWPGIFLGAFLLSLSTADHVGTSLALATGSTVEGVFALWLTNRYAGGRRFFEQPLNVLGFTVSASIASLLCPSIGVTNPEWRSFVIWAGDPYMWFVWWLGDMFSVLLLTPLLVAWTANPRVRWRGARALEFALLMVLLFLMVKAVFGGWSSASVSGYLFPYLCLPFLVWSAFRFGQREVTTASLLLAIIALWGTMQGRGMFAETALGNDLLQGQGFMAFNSVMVLAVAAVVAQRREAEHVRAQLLRRLDEAQETERGRISRQLHDQLGQELTALKLGLQLVKQQGPLPVDTRERFGQLEVLADDLMQNIHRLAWELHPAVLDDFGLETALRRYAEEWSQQCGVPAEVQSYGMEAQRLPAEIETTLYRVMQEALTNVFRHARAKRVGILLERRLNHISLIVEDDGRGFDADAVMQATGTKGKLGLLGMKERITLAGGTLEVESTPGQGATVLVRIPLRQEPVES